MDRDKVGARCGQSISFHKKIHKEPLHLNGSITCTRSLVPFFSNYFPPLCEYNDKKKALQGEEDGLEASDLLLIHTFVGLAMSAGTVIIGLIVLRPGPQCLISLQYLCQATLYGIGIYISYHLLKIYKSRWILTFD
jgi:hypothetical protein